MNNRIQITWKSYLYFSFISILAVPLALLGQLTPINFLLFCGIGIGVTTITGLYIFSLIAIMKTALQTQSRRTQEFISLSIITSSGAVRGLLVHFGIEWFHFTQPTSIWSRIGTSTATTLLWLTPIAIVITSTRSFKADYEKLLRDAVLTISRKIEIPHSNSLPKKFEADLLEIEVMLGHTFQKENPIHSAESLTFAAKWIKSLIEEKIRPLSHRLWIESISTPPKIHIGSSVVDSIKNLKTPPLPVSLFLSLITFINVSTSIGWQQGIFATLVIVFEVYSLLSFYQKKVYEYSSGNLVINILLLLTPGILVSLSFYVSNKFLFSKDFGSFNLIYILLFLMVAIPVSIFQITNQDRVQLLQAIEENLVSTGWFEQLQDKYLSQNAASYLHNLLQSELLSISYRMEKSANLDESIDSLVELEGLLSKVKKPITNDFKNFLYDPIARLDRLPVAWKGIADIDISIPVGVLQSHARNLLLVQFVEEAIANAVRHAGADRISVTAKLLPSQEVRFSIINNGVYLGPEAVGMGTVWLDHHAPNSWSRRETENGIELIITL